MNDIHTLSGAYAVDAVDDLERARFERHLADCADCRAEVASLREAGAVLAAATAAAPSLDLRERVLAEIKTVRPLPPEVTTGSGPRRVRRFPRILAAAASVVLLGAGVGLGVTQPWEEPRNTPVASRVINAGDVTSKQVAVEGGGTATVYHSRSEGRAVLRTRGVPAAPDGKTYEMWLQTKEGMVPAGLMDGGDATVVLEGDARDAVGVGITVEPEGGSEQPTSTPVVLVSL